MPEKENLDTESSKDSSQDSSMIPFLEEIIAPVLSHMAPIIISDLKIIPHHFLNEENVLTENNTPPNTQTETETALELINRCEIASEVTISTTSKAKEGQEEEKSEDFDDRNDDNEVIIIPDSPPVSAGYAISDPA